MWSFLQKRLLSVIQKHEIKEGTVNGEQMLATNQQIPGLNS